MLKQPKTADSSSPQISDSEKQINESRFGISLLDLYKPISNFIQSVTTGQINVLPDRSVPLTKTFFVSAHNAFNSFATGALIPNQQQSLTGLLNSGARGLELDLYFHRNAIRLCHAFCDPIFSNRLLSDALDEINAWLTQNPSEAIILKLEDHLSKGEFLGLKNMTDNIFGSRIFTTNNFNGTFPSINELVHNNKQVLFFPQNDQSIPSFFDGSWNGTLKNDWGTNGKIRSYQSGLNCSGIRAKFFHEVGEDKTLTGSVLNEFKLFFNLASLESPVAGVMTTEDVTKLQQCNAMISVDQFLPNDPRFATTTSLYEQFQGNVVLLMIAAIAAGFITPHTNDGAFISNIGPKMVIQLLVSAFLPPKMIAVYCMAEKGFANWHTAQKAVGQEKKWAFLNLLKDIGWTGIESLVRLGLTEVLSNAVNSYIVNPLNPGDPSVVRFVANAVITEVIMQLYKPGAKKLFNITKRFADSVIAKGARSLKEKMTKGLKNLFKIKDPSLTQKQKREL